jgi:hypothetical protein
MSATTLAPRPAAVPQEIAATYRPSRGPLGLVVGIATVVLFLFTADRIFSAGYLAPLLGIVWDADADAANAGGQWLVQGLLALVRGIPGAGPELLVLMTAGIVATMIGLFSSALRRRGWPASMSVLAGLLVAIHPVTLQLASTGQPAVLGLAATCILLICVDRAGALGDAQSLMALGLAFALLFITEPNALYVVLPVLAVLPWMLKEMRDGGSTAALFLIMIIPSIVAVATLLVGSMVVGVAPETTLRHWLAVLHGTLSDDAIGSTWLSRNGGTFFGPLTELVSLCLGCVPVILVVLWRMLISPLTDHRRPPIRFGTALLAVGIAPLAGAFAVLFWHPETGWTAVATALAVACTWAMTVRLRWLERTLWILAMLIGMILSWRMDWLWADPDKIAWHTALFRAL